ncbi:hypothetical protein RYX36_014024, partial [Vicia faba]
DFNASLNADVGGVDIIFKEYVINVGDDQRLDLSFIPSSGNSNNYAFINGIEVLSIPDDLYYKPTTDLGFPLDFNASLNADVRGVDIIFKEYVINVGDDQRLNLSFIPSSGNSNNYAFINGIEVLSIPDDLYYTPTTDLGFPLDFNASLNADVGAVDIIFKEYVINVGDDQRLDLSFIPSSGNSNNYAFINGIEVLSIPDDLYYKPTTDLGFPLVGSTIIPAYSISTNVAFETDYRIKV